MLVNRYINLNFPVSIIKDLFSGLILKFIKDMSKLNKILKYSFIILLVVLSSAACAPVKKNPWLEKRVKASRVNVTQLGRNKYYFSQEYQKKLVKSYKKK